MLPESVNMEGVMTASKELEDLFKDARQQVDSWPIWQRSLDPQGAEGFGGCEATPHKSDCHPSSVENKVKL